MALIKDYVARINAYFLIRNMNKRFEPKREIIDITPFVRIITRITKLPNRNLKQLNIQ